MFEFIHNFDLSVFNAVFSLHSDVMNTIMKCITYLGEEGVLWIVLSILLLLFKRTRKWGLAILGALAVMGIVNNEILKPIIARPRPFYVFDLSNLSPDHKYYEQIVAKVTENIKNYPELAAKWVSEYKFPNIVDRPTSWSFPSGHTSSAFACATAIFSNNKKWGVPALIFAALMGFTRIYLGVHYCTDVLAGAVAGVIYGIVCVAVVNFIVKFIKKKDYKIAKWF